MAAITLGLAEVEDRLQGLRRRLNLVTAQHCVYLGSSGFVVVLTLLLFMGLRVSPSTFHRAAWGSLLLVIGVVAVCALYAWRHWLDAAAVARLVDDRAQLADRLSTLVDLRLRPRTARLAPLLVAQTLALGTQWQVKRIAPRRVPRSIVVLIGSLLVLTGTTLVERDAPAPVPVLPPPPAHRDGSATAKSEDNFEPQSGSGTSRTGRTETQSGPQPFTNDSGHDRHSAGSDSATGQSDSSATGNSSAESKAAPASVTDRLQQTIQHAFRTDTPDLAREPAALAGNTSVRERPQQPERSTQHRGGNAAGQMPSENTNRTGQGDKRDSSRTTQSGSGQNAPQNFDGASPGAGEGSNPHGLMQPDAGSLAASEAGSTRFPLAINSFLRQVEQQGKQPGLRGKSTATGLAAGSGNAETALNEHQLSDDALRKPAIPPEYEDLIRSVFSSRGAR